MFDWLRDTAERADTDSLLDGMLITTQSGFLSGTLVATDRGWRPIDHLTVGEKVLTFDNGFQMVTEIQRSIIGDANGALMPAERPVFVPLGAMGNDRDLTLMPDQGVIMENTDTADPLDDPFVVVPSRALTVCDAVHTLEPDHPLMATLIAFEGDEVVYTEGGLLAFCPRPRQILSEWDHEDPDAYTVLDYRQGRDLVEKACALEPAAELVIHEPGVLLRAI